MATDIREWKEIITIAKFNWGLEDTFVLKLLPRSWFNHQYEVLFKERETEDGIRYYIAWVSLPGKLKDVYEFEGNRSGHLVAADTYDQAQERIRGNLLGPSINEDITKARERITAIIEEHIAYQKEASD